MAVMPKGIKEIRVGAKEPDSDISRIADALEYKAVLDFHRLCRDHAAILCEDEKKTPEELHELHLKLVESLLRKVVPPSFEERVILASKAAKTEIQKKDRDQ